jgi:hypothetical protein
MTTKLNSIDFMMMDVHRQLTDEELNEINPQAALDKTLGTEQEVVGDDESVAGASTRCEFCFGPMPCPQHSNVEPLDVVTSHNISATHVLAGAHNADLDVVVVVGFKKDGSEYFASSVSDAAESIYHLQRGIHKLNKMVDEGAGTNEHPDDAA